MPERRARLTPPFIWAGAAIVNLRFLVRVIFRGERTELCLEDGSCLSFTGDRDREELIEQLRDPLAVPASPHRCPMNSIGCPNPESCTGTYCDAAMKFYRAFEGQAIIKSEDSPDA